jgi:fructose-1,6-bisphosphatase I
MTHKLITLSQKAREDAQRDPEAGAGLLRLIDHVALAGKVISREVNRAGLADVLGMTGDVNGHGEAVRKLDVFAHDTIVGVLEESGCVAGVASEEADGIIPIRGRSPKEDLLLLFDPLDGSSNIDANVSIGTIFSVIRKRSLGHELELEDFLQPGTEQIAAGYIIYGSSTMLVYTLGSDVHGFTLDPSLGEFILSHPRIQTPRRGAIFSINLGNCEPAPRGDLHVPRGRQESRWQATPSLRGKSPWFDRRTGGRARLERLRGPSPDPAHQASSTRAAIHRQRR